MKHLITMTVFALGCSLVVAAGCARTAASRLYIVEPVAEQAEQSAAVGSPLVCVGPVDVAGYLDRPMLVSRGSGGRLILAEFDRWGEPLRAGIVRVLAANLERLLPGAVVVTYPCPTGASSDYRVGLRVQRFERTADGVARLSAHWTVTDGRTALRVQSADYRRAAGADHASLVAAHNQNLAELSRAVADALLQMAAARGEKTAD